VLTNQPGSTLPADPQSIWAALAAASADGLLVVSPDGVILGINERFGEVWGIPPAALDAGDDNSALSAAAELVVDPDMFLLRVREIYAQPTRTHDEVLLRDGRVLDRYGIPLHKPDGTYLGFAWWFRDVSEQKAVEADLRRLAETLQASLLPPRPPTIPGLEVAARYRPAFEAVAVGGDFYDVFKLRTNDWGLVLGDVCGKGVQAAQLTALARYTMRAAAVHHDEPGKVLTDLNRTLLGEPDLGERFVSAIYARIEQDVCGAWVTMAVAGHPLPVAVRRAGWIDVRGQPGGLLGLFDQIEVGEDRVGLGPGDSMVFCTDGVTEARNAAGEEFGDEALPELLLARTDADAEALADAIVAGVTHFTDQPSPDDIAVLVVRVPEDAGTDADQRLAALGRPGSGDLPGYPVGEPHWGATWRPAPPREARLKLAGEPTSASAARRFVAAVLHSWRFSAMANGDIELLTSELVGNAVRHASSPFTVIVRYDGDAIRVEVGDGSAALPRRLQPGPEATGGRGIQIVDDVASQWGVVSTRDGKRVWFEIHVTGG
jgi:anti-sigma regulatory factor (Ser/Thr protein kinase)